MRITAFRMYALRFRIHGYSSVGRPERAIDQRIPHRNTECSRAGAKYDGTGKRPLENMGRKLDEHFGGCSERLEDDVKRVITFLNEKVMPEVRENSTKALRIAAEQLARLADHLERSRKAQP